MHCSAQVGPFDAILEHERDNLYGKSIMSPRILLLALSAGLLIVFGVSLYANVAGRSIIHFAVFYPLVFVAGTIVLWLSARPIRDQYREFLRQNPAARVADRKRNRLMYVGLFLMAMSVSLPLLLMLPGAKSSDAVVAVVVAGTVICTIVGLPLVAYRLWRLWTTYISNVYRR